MQSKIQKDFNAQEATVSSSPTIHEKLGLVYGGFWIRFCAKLLDWTICSILIAVLPLPDFYHSDVIIVSNHATFISSFFVKWFVPALYTTLFLVHYQATPGKMAFSLRVIHASNDRLTYGTALARFFVEIISAFFLFMGYLLAIFDIKKRTLHDRLCHTYVVQAKQIVYQHSNAIDLEDEPDAFHSEPDITVIHDRNIYGFHTVLFSTIILESLFSIAYCVMEDPLFRMVTWSLNVLIGIFLMIAVLKQSYPHFSTSIRRLTWGICFYYCIITPIVYFIAFLIGIDHFLHNIPLPMDDPIVFMTQLMFSIMNYLIIFSWPQVLISMFFIPCSLVLGVWGIILVSSKK